MQPPQPNNPQGPGPQGPRPPQGPQGPQNPRDPKKPPFTFRNNYLALVFMALIVTSFMVLVFSDRSAGVREIPYSQFLGYVRAGEIETVQIIEQREIRGTFKQVVDSTTTEFKTNIPYFDAELIQLLHSQGVRFSGSPRRITPLSVLLDILPWVIGFAIIWFMFRQIQGTGSRALSFGRSRARKVDIEKEKVTFADVAGQKEPKYELQEIVQFLKKPEKFIKIGARIPKGILLVGMPGTGKTLLARACAGEAGVNFFQMSGSDFVEMFVGVGASRVRDLFEQGKRSAPCILFVDELDAVGRVRGAGYGGGHDEREQTLNQMLVEMDGFDTKEGVIMLAATNRPDVLDPALLRPGRFDRQIVIDMPDIIERQDILTIHTAKLKLARDVNLNRLARATPGCSGADLANLSNEAALFAARNNRIIVSMADFEEARDKIFMGVARKSRTLSEDEKKRTAYHESGHALLHYHCKYADPLHKVTVIPRGRALGLAFSLPNEDVYSRGKNWLLDRIKICYGGFVAEELIYNETSTGTQQDLEQATSLARKMVTEWGMSSLGAVSLGQEEAPIFLGKEIARHHDYSDTTAAAIDQEMRAILEGCLDEVRSILRDHRDELEILTQALIERETLDDIDILKLLKRPLPESPPPNKRRARRKSSAAASRTK